MEEANLECVHDEMGGTTITIENDTPQAIDGAPVVPDGISGVTSNTGQSQSDSEAVIPVVNNAIPSTPIRNAVNSAVMLEHL